MGHLAHCADVRASRIKVDVPGLIERAITDALVPIRIERKELREFIEGHKLALDTLTVRVEALEQSQGVADIVTDLKANIMGLRKYVDQLKSMALSMLFGTVEIPEMPSDEILASYEVPLATIRDKIRVDDADAESDAEKNEEQLGVIDKVVYDDLET